MPTTPLREATASYASSFTNRGVLPARKFGLWKMGRFISGERGGDRVGETLPYSGTYWRSNGGES
jgi:hypothetical protein